MFTLIPNLASPIYGRLCNYWSKSVYESHNAHDMKSFLRGHKNAGLHVIDSGYLGSIEFGMLSAAIHGPERKTQFAGNAYTPRSSKL